MELHNKAFNNKRENREFGLAQSENKAETNRLSILNTDITPQQSEALPALSKASQKTPTQFA